MRGTLNRPSGVDLGCDAQNRHCERPKTARQSRVAVTALDCFAPLAMTKGWVLSQQFLNLFPQLFRLRGRRMPRYDLSFAVHQDFGEIPFDPAAEDRKRVVSGKIVSVRVDLGARRYINNKNNKTVYST